MPQVPKKPGKTVSDYRALFLSGCALLDVRAPIEFKKGAFPGSVNLPLMSDEERHLVGVRYKEAGQQSAIALGAELVTPDIQAHRVQQWITFVQAHPDALLYCFRGGLRSRITQQWLIEAGVNIPLIEGGYKALRTYLMDELNRLSTTLPYVLIGGRTGNGKTLLLNELGSTVDLEHLANHRGSSFGNMPDAQPTPIDFENALSIALMQREAAGSSMVFLEDEARLIGRICIPDVFRDAMNKAPLYILKCDMSKRIDNCFDDYVTDLLKRYEMLLGKQAGFDAYSEHHRSSLARIQKRFGGQNYQQALDLLDTALALHDRHNDTSLYSPFIEMLLRDYYDPMYDYQLKQKASRIVFEGTHQQILDKAALHSLANSEGHTVL